MQDSAKRRLLIRQGRESELDRLWLLRSDAIRAGCASHYAPELVAAWAAVQQTEGFAKALAATDFRVAENNGAVAGFGFFDPATSRLQALFVAPNAVRSGVGSALVRELENAARARGCCQVDLQATLNAEIFYARLGYAVIRRTVWSHPDGFELPCVEMRADLTDLSIAGASVNANK